MCAYTNNKVVTIYFKTTFMVIHVQLSNALTSNFMCTVYPKRNVVSFIFII